MTDEAVDPQKLAYSIAVETSERDDAVGDFATSIELDNNVIDFRFVSTLVGYEGWQWSVTLYHDVEAERWTVNESTLVPTDDSLLPPPWIPWKDRLKPSDLSVMDSIGTDANDARLEDGFRPVNNPEENTAEEASKKANSVDTDSDAANNVDNAESAKSTNNDTQGENNTQDTNELSQDKTDFDEDLEEAVSTFRLSRRRVMTTEAISQTAKHWYAGQHGPKSLSTKIADGKACSSCGFLIPLVGSLGSMFGVCANMWSPDDGRVVSLDHACGEHSDIEPPEPSQLWIQSAPAYDDYHIDILQQSPREERADVELIEESIENSKSHRRRHRKQENIIAEDIVSDDPAVDSYANSEGTANSDDNADTDTTAAADEYTKNTDMTALENVKSEDAVANTETETATNTDTETNASNNQEEDYADEQISQSELVVSSTSVSSISSMRLYKKKSRRQHK